MRNAINTQETSCRPVFQNPCNHGVSGKYSVDVINTTKVHRGQIARTASEDAAVRDSSSSSTPQQSFLLSLLDSIKFISRKVPRGCCGSRCECACHRTGGPKVKSEDSTNNSTKCTSPRCRSRESRNTEFVVRNPILLQRHFFLSLISRGAQISCSIKTRPIVPENSAVIKCAENGDLISLINLLRAKKASIFDTEPDGWSLLHVCATVQYQLFSIY
jgi:hypothetical protein